MFEKVPLARGMRDLFEEQLAIVLHVEAVFKDRFSAYGYEPIRLPMLEHTTLFKRGLGESTDAVTKEMFTFDDESLALRPEGTASSVRAVIENSLYRGNQPKLWYSGPMFRRERPQHGRFRQFYQVGAEAFGFAGPDVDVELIQLVHDVWNELRINSAIELEINSLGNAASRAAYRDALVDYLTPREQDIDEDSQRRLTQNPLRILDSKNAKTQKIVQAGPKIKEYLDAESVEHFDALCDDLRSRNIDFKHNDTLVRGLDYYTHGVFEWNTERLGAQKQVGGGGRYDGLCELLGGEHCPATGFAIGIDRVALLMADLAIEVPSVKPDIYVLALDDEQENYARQVASSLRTASKFRVRYHHGGGKSRVKMRAADRSQARYALIIGDREAATEQVTVKWLRDNRDQVTIPTAQLVSFLENAVNEVPVD